MNKKYKLDFNYIRNLSPENRLRIVYLADLMRCGQYSVSWLLSLFSENPNLYPNHIKDFNCCLMRSRILKKYLLSMKLKGAWMPWYLNRIVPISMTEKDFYLLSSLIMENLAI